MYLKLKIKELIKSVVNFSFVFIKRGKKKFKHIARIIKHIAQTAESGNKTKKSFDKAK